MTVKQSKATASGSTSADIAEWDIENEAFWESKGKRIANRNLWISIPALLCGFAVWGMWGIITVQMLNLGFPFTQAELFTLTAIAGISGATMRIPASFLIRLAGGRNTIFLTTAMLLAPAIGTGIALQHPSWPLWSFQLMALTFALVFTRVSAIMRGEKELNAFQSDGRDLNAFGLRMTRSHANALENLALAVGLMLLAIATGHTDITDKLAMVVLYARIAQSVVHIASTSAPMVMARATLFSVQMLIFAYWGWMLSQAH